MVYRLTVNYLLKNMMKKLKNIFFLVALLLLIGIFFYSQEEQPENIASKLTVRREQAEQAFFSTGTSSLSFSQQWEHIYTEQYNHLTGCRKYYGLINDKDNALLCRTKQRNLIEEAKLQLGIQFNPDRPMTQFDIFYGLDTMDSIYISQDGKNHYLSNGLLSTDIATGGKKLKVYAMDCNLEMCEWIITSDYNEGKGHMVILTNKEKNMQFRYGHTLLTTTESTVLTSDEVGVILCPDDEGAGITTGCHLDWSYWTKSNGTWKQTEYKDDKNYNIEKIIEEKILSKKILNTVDTETHLAEASEMYKGYATPWQILSAKHMRESGRQKVQPKISTAGARGAMQFLPCTWFNYGADVYNPKGCFTVVNVDNAFSGKYPHARGYATDGDGDGIADINNLKDALASADKHFQANIKSTGSVRGAVYQYNNASWYVDQVLKEAQRLGLTI